LSNVNSIRLTMIEPHECDRLGVLDPQAVAAVYNQYFPEVFRYVKYRLDDESLAEDISSEVFFRLLKAVKNGCGPGKNLRGWLLGTARHMVVDHIRREYRHPCLSLSVAIESDEEAAHDQVERRDSAHALQLALVQLTEDQQQVLTLRFGQGFSLEETAELMKKKINAVKALQFRALNALQRRMGEEYE
ncbi:MAG: sigma-70 family RNA polymerase sigma factor, partial [Anaerolineales bacterium]